MAASIPSEQQQLLMAGYVLGDLSPEEATAFEQLIAADPSLRSALTELQQSLDLAFVSEVQPPAHLKASILTAHQVIQELAPRHRAQSPSPPQGQRSAAVIYPDWGWFGGLGAVATLLILGLSFNNYTLRQSLQALRTEEPPAKTLTFALTSTEADNAGRVTVRVNPDNLEGTIQVKDLPPLEAGQVYVLWTVVEAGAPVTTDGKNAILTEVFTVDAQGTFYQPITVPSVFRDRNLVKAVAITIENAAAPQRHQSAPILIEQL